MPGHRGNNSSWHGRRILEERPQKAHGGELQGEPKTVGSAALLDDLRVVGVIEVEVPGQLLGRRIADIPAVALALRGAQEANGHGSLPTGGVAQTKLLSQLRKGDVLVVWKLDRLSRSLRDVLTIMERVQESKAGFRSLTEAVDTTTPVGRMMMQMVGAFAEFERAMLKERTKAGLDAARKEGRIGGRPPKLKPQQQQEIVKLVKRGKKTAADAARLFGVHPATVSRLLQRT